MLVVGPKICHVTASRVAASRENQTQPEQRVLTLAAVEGRHHCHWSKRFHCPQITPGFPTYAGRIFNCGVLAARVMCLAAYWQPSMYLPVIFTLSISKYWIRIT